MQPNEKTDWIHLAMFCLIAILAGGWLIYYINDTSEEETSPRYYLYKVVREETRLAAISNPATGYGKVTVKGKVTGTDMMGAAISNYFLIDGKYWEQYVGKFVEATGYLTQTNVTDSKNPLSLAIENITLAPENEVDDAGNPCKSQDDCRYQCVMAASDYKKQCPDGQGSQNCSGLTGSCSEAENDSEKTGEFILLGN